VVRGFQGRLQKPLRAQGKLRGQPELSVFGAAFDGGGGSVRVDTRMSVEVGCTDRGFVEVCTLCAGVGAF